MADLNIQSTDGILILSFNRPQVMNALTWEMLREIKRQLQDAAHDNRTRVVILRGEGNNFCAGADIRVEKNCTPNEYRAFVSDIQDITRALQNMDAVSIAAIQGYCLGGGMEIACACDFRIAAHDAQLGFPEVRIGLTITSGAAGLLPRLIGMARAKELMLTGEWVSAPQAERIGLATKLVLRADLMNAARNLATKLKAHAPLAVAAQKHLLEAGADAPLDVTLKMEVEAILGVFNSHDGQEGMGAFIEKRPPQFTGT